MRPHNTPGFTLVEIAVVAPIVILIIGIFIGIAVALTGNALEARGTSIAIHEANAAIKQIKHDIRTSQNFLSANTIPLQSGQGRNGYTSNFTNSDGSTLILSQYAYTKAVSSKNRELVYLQNKPNPCDVPAVTSNDTLMYNVVYFIKTVDGKKTLWRRTILPNTYLSAGCNDPAQVPSCSEGATQTFCKATDVMVLDNIDEFSISYYKKPNEILKITTPTLQGSLDNAQTIEIKISTKNKLGGRIIDYSTAFRATKINT